MFHRDGLRKAIALAAVFALFFQMDILMNAQSVGEIERQFQVAKNLYNEGKYDDSRLRIGRLLDVINEKGIESKYIRAQCYLILGAICEQESNPGCAEENYRIAGETGITKVDGVDLDSLELYRKIVKGERPPTDDRVITGEGKKKKKKFPWLLVAGGVVVVAVAAILLLKKKEKKTFTLNVTKGVGVEGNPVTGTYIYTKGQRVDYRYTLADEYDKMTITLDGNPAEYSGHAEVTGTIIMDRDHTLEVEGTQDTINELVFITDRNEVEINEGDEASFLVYLSIDPGTDITVNISPQNTDSLIKVIEGNKHTFTLGNWNLRLTVKLKAGTDTNKDTEEEILNISDEKGIVPTKSINVKIIDKDTGYKGPGVWIDNPSDGEEVTGDIDIQAWAEDTLYGIEKVEFFIDGTSVQTDRSSPYSYQWKTRDSGKGPHVIKVVATNNNGVEIDHSITVNVVYDDPPTVQIISPQNGATVSGVITIKVEPQDDVGIARVELRVNDDPVQTLYASPYYFELDTNALNNGTNFIKVNAVDTAGQSGSQEIEITVDNRE